jgi:hypothetical protein
LEECGPYLVLASYNLAFALQPRKKHRKTSVRVAASKNGMRRNAKEEMIFDLETLVFY